VGLSVGKYFTPKGVSLAGVGITPDVVVPVDEKTADAIYYDQLEPEDDPQIQAALELLEMGAQNVLVSLGGEGALWVSERGAMFTPAIPVRVQSTVGAGDAMVGGVMAGLEKTGDVHRALAYGAAAGCASVMTEGTQLIRPDDFAALLPQVQIQDV